MPAHPTRLAQTQAQLLRHHGHDGQASVHTLTRGYARRHDEAFWQYWQQYCEPALQGSKHPKLVDLGAGTGLFMRDLSQRYPQARVAGIECAPYMLEAQVDLPKNADIYVQDLNQPELTQFKEKSVDLASCNLVIHELNQPILLLQAIRHWLKPSGRLYLVDLVRQPLDQYLQRRYAGLDLTQESIERDDLEDAFQHFLEHNRYQAIDLLYLLKACGFKILQEELIQQGRQLRLVAQVR
ncbi:Methyltransferase domain-containing protein [Allopseudospirillum japonicum]|uniref:Methyltransferase domain-containing protein n=1 Tax=Allopseudospirillum japonicum TaxID=64971 RepID=A0A1H6TFX5_9GAMM|nr:class I SAM-dependent methyltransferase [Allopseudospirillum japonicum]SEI78196.1 Methyltransferase domain-containing protein [Allopseudospirillum japonicum]